jgi:hypothetical protein
MLISDRERERKKLMAQNAEFSPDYFHHKIWIKWHTDSQRDDIFMQNNIIIEFKWQLCASDLIKVDILTEVNKIE